jgi:CRP-like cAMP-binding protein
LSTRVQAGRTPDPLRSAETLREMARRLSPSTQRLGAGDVVFTVGDRCDSIQILDGGIVRLTSADGDDAGFAFRGDWLGLDGLQAGRHRTTATVIDCCIVWTIRVEALLAAGLFHPELVQVLRQATRPRGTAQPRTESSEAERIALFLQAWADALVRDGRHAGQVALCVTADELGGYLGMPAEAVRCGLGELTSDRVVDCSGDGRDVRLDDLDRLRAYTGALVRH